MAPGDPAAGVAAQPQLPVYYLLRPHPRNPVLGAYLAQSSPAHYRVKDHAVAVRLLLLVSFSHD